ncbi:MAG: T9SS type A sorting domain-containing protein [Saprospiraceae bacterium]|nr:T9SS type A sorting domain-containing protein [Saprospiraceae bacterium]
MKYWKADLQTDVNSDVAIYPNPTLSSFFVDSKEDADVQIFDLSGKQVGNTLKVSSTQSLEVNTEVFTSGVYVVKVSNDKFVSTKKVVIKK